MHEQEWLINVSLFLVNLNLFGIDKQKHRLIKNFHFSNVIKIRV